MAYDTPCNVPLFKNLFHDNIRFIKINRCKRYWVFNVGENDPFSTVVNGSITKKKKSSHELIKTHFISHLQTIETILNMLAG